LAITKSQQLAYNVKVTWFYKFYLVLILSQCGISKKKYKENIDFTGVNLKRYAC